MNKSQKEVLQASLRSEKAVLKKLEQVYKQALKDIDEKIILLQTDPLSKSKAYQKDFQDILRGQITSLLENLQNSNYKSIDDYLKDCYNIGYIGTMYDIQKQGIPLMLPLNQEEVLEAVTLETKLSKNLYSKLGENTNTLKKKIVSELSRGISQGMMYVDIARNISNISKVDLNNSLRIARTEGHRVQNSAAFKAQHKAKNNGADIVKQWDSTLDGRTRATHKVLDGTILELDKKFESGKNKADYPGGFGVPSEDCNCRCALLQRAKWALDKNELKTLEERAAWYNLDKTKNFEDYKQKFLKLPPNINNKKAYPDTLAGVVRGKPMSFEEANNYNVNPNYKKDIGYSQNCQSCVVVFEARQRGYNLQTKPYKLGSVLEQLSKDTRKAWIDPVTNKKPEFLAKDPNGYTARTYFNYMESTIKQDERYTMQFLWKAGGGHIVNVDRTSKGELRIKDNQRGKGEKSEWIGKEIKDYLKQLKYKRRFLGISVDVSPDLLRVDNLEFNKSILKSIAEENKNKRGRL